MERDARRVQEERTDVDRWPLALLDRQMIPVGKRRPFPLCSRPKGRG